MRRNRNGLEIKAGLILKNLFIPSTFINCNNFGKRPFSISDRDINEPNEINREPERGERENGREKMRECERLLNERVDSR